MKKVLTTLMTLFVLSMSVFTLNACGVEFKVNFVVDGAVYATIDTSGQEIIKMPENPTKEDCTFDGWFWDKDVWEKPFTANSLLDAPLSSDMSVYAKFTKNHTHEYGAWVSNGDGTHTKTCANDNSHKITEDCTFGSNKACKECGYINTALLGTEISSDVYTINGTNLFVKVPNSQNYFNFAETINVADGANYKVYTDINCKEIDCIPSYAVNDLKVENNTYYFLVSNGNAIPKVYTVTVRRRPMYDVTFIVNGGTSVVKQVIEEDDFATEPTTTRAGYDFDGWDYDFTTPITKNTEINAIWTARDDTPYKVEYYLQNLENDNYTKQETVNKTGTTDTIANAEIKTFAHFTHKASSTDSGNIAPNGSTVLKVYYTRDKYTVTFNGNGGTLVSGNTSQTVKYGGSVVAPTFAKTGYSLAGFDKKLTNVSESFTTNANWKINQYTLTIVYGNGQKDKLITQDFNTNININQPTREYYEFIGWDKTMPTKMPAENITITASWKSIFTLSGNTITGLTSYGKNNYTELIIPSVIDGVSVTSISSSAFEDCSSLTSVVIPDSVTSIGYGAFSGCSSLTSITLPFVGAKAGVTSSDTYQYPFGYIFGTSSYSGSYSATQYYYGSSTSSTTTSTYYIPSSLKSVTITGGNILYGAFYNCSSLTSVVIGDSVTSIGNYAFRDCSSLTSVVIGDSVTSIGEYAFYNCTSLTSIEIPDSVTSIGNHAFEDCESLTSVEIPDSVTSIGYMAFRDCSSLTSVVIGDNVTSIGNYAFYACDSLTYNIKDGLKYLGNNNNKYLYLADVESNSITSATIDNNCRFIGSSAFTSCSSLTSIEIPESVTSIGYEAFSGCSSLTSVEIPNSVTSIGSSVFYDCKSLTSVVIPDSVTSIGSSAFNNCSSLTSVVIPDNVTSIGAWAFDNCSSLTSVVIGDSVTSIGDSAFRGCSSLKSVVIGDSVTSISYQAFYRCSKLTSVVIGDSVTSIGYQAFAYCSSLTSIKYRGTTSQWQAITKGTYWNSNTGNYTITYNYTGN